MKNLTWQNPEQLFVAQVLINKVKSKCCGIKEKDTVAIDNEISANVRGKVAFRKIICSANILSQSVSQSAHRLGLFFR